MKRRPGKVQFYALIDDALYYRFNKLLPMTGANVWFIRQAVENFCDMMEENPTLHEQIVASVQRLLSETRTKARRTA